MKYPVIIFDWDGTLMDSIDKIVVCMKQAAIVTGLEEPSSQAIRNIIGLSLDKAMAKLYPTQPAHQQVAVKNAYREQYLYYDQQQTPFYPGVKEWLTSLKEQGYTLAVATGKGRNGLNRILEQHDVHDLFTVTYCADETNSKPDPLMLNKILEDLDIQPHQALMIGDSSYDLEMANNANIACVGVDYGVHSHTVLSQFQPLAILSDLPNELGAYI
jgi:phosphoglycolate phosphatase